MEPDQQLAAEKNDQEKLQTSNVQKKEAENVSIEKIQEPVLPELEKDSQALEKNSVDPVKSSADTSKVYDQENLSDVKKEQSPHLENDENVKEVKAATETEPVTDETENKENSQENDLDKVNKADESCGSKAQLPSFPGTVTKSVPGSNDVKIEIDSNSLLDRVILYSLKNTVVDNSRLDAAKNKYMMNRGNITSNFNTNSNGSDSNSSSKSVEKLIEEFKGGCSKDTNDSPSSETSTTSVKQKSDIRIESSNGADTCVNTSNISPLRVVKEESSVTEDQLNVITSSPPVEKQKSVEPQPNDVQDSSEIRQSEVTQQIEALAPKPNLEDNALDFRDQNTPNSERNEHTQNSSPAMLDLSIPNRDERSVPIIKRNHALYVGLPDFSKQIFSAPSINRLAATAPTQLAHSSESAGAPKIRNPDFSGIPRSAPEMHMRQPDFSKSFSKVENSPSSIPVTPSNFPDIVRKNNYISDLQLKPPSTASANLPIPTSSSSSSSSSYKIDFRSSVAISQKLMQEAKPEQPSTSQTIYPNMKKEGINAYNQQLIDEPMAHIIHKNQFLPHANDPSRVGGWNEKNERLLGGSSSSVSQVSERQSNNQHMMEAEVPGSSHPFPNPSEDLRKSHPAYYTTQYSYKERDFNNVSQESQMSHEFSLKQKEQQLRQEGTIITIKNEATITPTKEMSERRSADLFRDYKLKQPKESPDSARKISEHTSIGYPQAYPDFPSKFAKYNQTKVETIVKPNHISPAPPLAYPQDRQVKQIPTSSRNFHSPSPVSYHHQSISPHAIPPGSSMMNPPQHWPPPLVQQQVSRHLTSPANASANIPSQSSSNYTQNHSQSSHINYGYSYPIPAPPGPSAVKVNSNYHPHRSTDPYLSRNVDIKEIPNRHYQPPSSSSQGQNYYHQNYPDFARHFDPDKKSLTQEQNVKYPPNFAQMDQRQQSSPDINYQRFPPHNELEIRAVRDREHQAQYHRETGNSYYPLNREREVEHEYLPPRAQEPQIRHQEIRLNDDRARVHQPLKIERRIDEPPKIIAGPSNLHLQRPQPTEVSVIAKVKIEPAVPQRNIPSTSTIIKSAKSIFAEVKRESPLDLSVKTVKTKADSTGCDQDIPTRQRPEPSGLKVEFTPNFNKSEKTDCRNQARLGPQDFPSSRAPLNASERPSTSQKYSTEVQNNRTLPAAVAPSLHHHQQSLHQVPQHALGNRNYYHEHRFQPVKEVERPNAPAPALPSSSQYSERSSYPIESRPHNSVELQRSGPIVNSHYPRKEFSRSDEKAANDSKRVNPYYLPPQQNAQVPTVPLSNASKVVTSHSSSTTDAARLPNNVPNHIPNHRDPLYHEREKDRKYVEDILYGRKRNEALTNHPDLRHFQPIVSPPRKRILEQHQISSSVPPKQVRIEDPSRLVQEPRHHADVPPNEPTAEHFNHFEQQRFQKVENHLKPPILGQPPALVKSEHYQKPTAQGYDPKYHPDMRKDVSVKQALPVNNAQYSNSQYYPNPKAEMIHRSDPSGSYKQERLQYANQNFQQRPDDSTLQIYPRIHHPIQQESNIRIEHQLAGPRPSSGEPVRLINGNIPPSISGSNGNIARGADQSTILKLKTNLELKEQKKLIIHKSEPGEDLDQTKKDLSPRQFRTKGELKGFIPLPTLDVKKDATTTIVSSASAAPSAFDLLDWGSACNDFVQQLETGKKRLKKKRSVNSKVNDGKTDEKPTVGIPGTTANNSSEIPKEVLNSINENERNSSSDEDKPLLELVNSQNSGEASTVVGKTFGKNARILREKQRLEIEQKHAARLGPSSSESESDARRPVRTAIRVRRLRKRAALGIKKTDEELSVEEEETEEEITHKRRTTRSISKLDDLTSSEEEKKKTYAKEKKSAEERKTAKAVKKALSAKPDTKKQESSSESSDSDDSTPKKLSKLSAAKNAKKLKDLGDGSNLKKMLEEEKTMTRSKRKLEIEKKLSNSKILRNEKIVQNVSPDKKTKAESSPTSTKKILPKRKDSTTRMEDTKRKVDESESDENGSKTKKRLRRVSKIGSSSSSDESQVEEESKAERLRPRKAKPETESTPKASKELSKKKPEDKAQASKAPNDEIAAENEVKTTMPCRIPFTGIFPFKDEKISKFTPGWEADTYNYKRSLKIPAGLITIGRPPQHGISHSLPDLDPQTSDTSEIFSEFVKSKDKYGSKDDDPKGKAESSKTVKPDILAPKKPNSIIDLLHQRVVQSRKKFKAKKASNIAGLTTKANEDDLLPTPEKESEKVFGFKVNIFETSIITSRTRTENNALRKKEILKEVFGAEDERPKSAPPVGAAKTEDDDTQQEPPEADTKISYDQKYREYLEKMNVDFLPKSNDTSKIEDCKTADTSVKDEDDDDDDNETVVASERDLVTPTMKGKVKKGRGRRCKGSSGFDYIRKKKKPTTNASENPLSVNNIIKKRLAAMENLENKDETDIGKEMKGWVLNKGVGESVLHKASRLDYVDVIAYCLERLNMSPDQKDNAGYTPLHEACSRGHLEIARILLLYGANHSETALSGIRPLHEAIENGHVEIVRLLISFGADPCLATYSGQLPIAMAEDKEMEDFLSEYLIDIDNKKGKTTSWFFDGPFKKEDPSEEGFEVFNHIPINKTDLGSSVASVFSTSMTSLVTATTQMSDNETVVSETTATPIKAPATPMKAPSQDLIKYQHKMKKCDTNSNNLVMSDANNQDNSKFSPMGRKTKVCSVVLNQIDSAMKKIKKLPAIPKQELMTPSKLPEPIQKLEDLKHKDDYDDMVDGDNLESDSEFLEVEESEAPLPPLYLLKDEGSDKWILLTDLYNLLKVKSKDAVLKQICPSSPPALNKELIRELKMSDFLEKAICLQLFCAGEKLNVRASKVSLVRYNDSVRNLLGVQTIRMNM